MYVDENLSLSKTSLKPYIIKTFHTQKSQKSRKSKIFLRIQKISRERVLFLKERWWHLQLWVRTMFHCTYLEMKVRRYVWRSLSLSLKLNKEKNVRERCTGEREVCTFESVYFTRFVRYCTWKDVGENRYVRDCFRCIYFLPSPPFLTPYRFLKDVDQFNETTVSAFVTAGGVIFLLLHKKKNYSQYRIFFEKVHEIFVKVFCFPFLSLSFFYKLKFQQFLFLAGNYESVL